MHISNSLNKDELLQELSTKLNLPDYFGFNWDSLEECFRDLHWLPEQEIIIIHDILPKLDGKDLKIYLEILVETVKNWRKKNEERVSQKHILTIIFDIKDEQLVNESLL